MQPNIAEKLLKIGDEIARNGNANLTRLTVMKKWFERPERLSAFAVWIATRAVSRKGKIGGAAAELFREAERLLVCADGRPPKPNRKAAEALHRRLVDFQDERHKLRWGSARIIHNWNLMLVEHALAI